MNTHFEVDNSVDGIEVIDKFYLAVPEMRDTMKKYDSKVVMFIVCMFDYWSPYRNVEFEERKMIVCNDIFQDSKAHVSIMKDQMVKRAIKKYKDLQYDPILDSYNVIGKKVRLMNEVIDQKEVTLESIKNIQDAIKGNEKINEMMMKMQEHIKEMERKSPFRGFTNIEDYHNF